MKRILVILLAINGICLKAISDNSNRIPLAQVQFCQGTEALGNEGQGMAAAAFINFSSSKTNTNDQIELKCELAMAFAYEYGNDIGFKLGQMTPYTMYPIRAAKTNCIASEENGEIILTVTKMKKILINKCKLTPDGF